MQDEKGAAYIDVNVGPRPPEFMADMVRKLQGVTAKPLSIDTPDVEIARAGLQAYDLAHRRAAANRSSIRSVHAADMFELYKICPFKPILLVSENVIGGKSKPCRTAEEPTSSPGGPLRPFSHDAPARQGRLHYRPGHCTLGQRLGRQPPSPGRRHAIDSSGHVLRRLPCLGRLEQFHRHAAAEAARRFAGQGPAGDASS